MKFHNKFVGSDSINIITSFGPGDTSHRFNENRKKMTSDWYYHTVDISYSFNENGHRSTSVKSLDLENYILFSGCSHTFGLGLELEKTYPYLLANKLKCDYYNLAMPGTGIDIMEYNLLTWFAKFKQKPKLVVVQVPDHTRFSAHNPEISTILLLQKGVWSVDEGVVKLVASADSCGFFNSRKLFVMRNLYNVIDVPIIVCTVGGLANESSDLKMRNVDLARDLSHSGMRTHSNFASDIYQYIINNYSSLISQ